MEASPWGCLPSSRDLAHAFQRASWNWRSDWMCLFLVHDMCNAKALEPYEEGSYIDCHSHPVRFVRKCRWVCVSTNVQVLRCQGVEAEHTLYSGNPAQVRT